MFTLLYTNGCSWVKGNGIEQDPKYAHLPVPDRWAKFKTDSWPALLSKSLDVPLQNDGQGARSNARMVRTTCDFLQNYTGDKSKLLVILGWTSVDRDELYLDDGHGKEGWVNFNATQPVSSHGAFWTHDMDERYLKRVDRWQQDYITDIFSSYERHHKFFQQMYLMKNLLENQGISYIFYNSMAWRDKKFDWTRSASTDIDNKFKDVMSKLISPNIFTTRDCEEHLNVMETFCRHNNFPMCPDNHTQTEGHAAWARHLYQEVINLYPELLKGINQ